MKVYFVRHGETKENATNIHQASTADLSEKGINQAHLVAERLESFPINLIISSTHDRTKQTAEIINSRIKKPAKESDLFIERKRPTVIEGLEYEHPKAVEIKSQIHANYHIPEFRHSDEETFFQMKERAKKALDFLENLEEENVLVVTHSDFILCMLGIMIFGDEFNAHDDLKFVSTFQSNNTGITCCEFTNKWRIKSWNDHSHLK